MRDGRARRVGPPGRLAFAFGPPLLFVGGVQNEGVGLVMIVVCVAAVVLVGCVAIAGLVFYLVMRSRKARASEGTYRKG